MCKSQRFKLECIDQVHRCRVTGREQGVHLQLWDTAGQEKLVQFICLTVLMLFI